MSGERGSYVFFYGAEVQAVEDALVSVLDSVGFTHGAMRKIPVGSISAARNGWVLLLPEPPLEPSRWLDRTAPWLAAITKDLGCYAFQLDVHQYSTGLLEANAAGDHLVSGLLHRPDDQLPDLDEADDADFPRGGPAPLRALLRGRDPALDEQRALVKKLLRALVGDQVDPYAREPYAPEDSEVVFFVPRQKTS